jgi:hypothetical protein
MPPPTGIARELEEGGHLPRFEIIPYMVQAARITVAAAYIPIIVSFIGSPALRSLVLQPTTAVLQGTPDIIFPTTSNTAQTPNRVIPIFYLICR